jgi:hypothetical protein
MEPLERAIAEKKAIQELSKKTKLGLKQNLK